MKWVAGAFVADQEWSHLDYETAPGFSNSFQNIYGYNINTDPVLNPMSALRHTTRTSGTTTWYGPSMTITT